MYAHLYQLDVIPEQREAFREMSRRHAEESLREEPGTLRFDYIQDEADENRFYVFEGYTDQEALQTHLQGPVFQRNWPHMSPMFAERPHKLGGGFEL